MGRILIADDDAQLRNSFVRVLSGEGHKVRAVSSGEAAVEAVKEECFDLAILDVRMSGMSGLEAFEAMRKTDPKIQVIIMTAYGTTETAIEATRLGAYDYVLKPFDIPDILKVIDQAMEAGRFMRKRVKMGSDDDEEGDAEAIIGTSKAMHEVYKAIGRCAPTNALVLIRGESGTGKELAARAVFHYSKRADDPFMVINCVAIPETLLESELFGYEKGAFTGAQARKLGKIEQAHKGTVFLDEIGDMPLAIQAKLLRLLQEKKIERLGGRSPIDVDVRIIAATNRDLEAAVSRGEFREDLYYRLNVVAIEMPPLRKRPEDIPLLAEYFLNKYAREMKMASPGLTRDAMRVLKGMPWPGNARELANAMQKAMIFNRGCPIGPEELLRATDNLPDPGRSAENGDEIEHVFADWARRGLSGELAFDQLMDQVGRVVISEALKLTGGNRTQAAKLLGMTRPTLLARIDKYGLKVETIIT